VIDRILLQRKKRKVLVNMTDPKQSTFVVEHIDPELGPWSALEYACIAKECKQAGAQFLLTSVPETLQMPDNLARMEELQVERRSVEEIFADRKSRVCLLDPAATTELSPADGNDFDVFLFGGILGTHV
jgi:carboxypeptidase D